MALQTYNLAQPFELECGTILPSVKIAYQTFGTLNEAKDNVVWVCHALTASSDVLDWWKGLCGEDDLLNPKDHFIVCANMVGSCYGSSNALNSTNNEGEVFYDKFPLITIRDIVRGNELLRQHLNIEKINLLIGGSMGGQQALEWSISQPDLIENLMVMATNAKHSPWGIAFNEAQRLAIFADPTYFEKRKEGGLNGMKSARALALLSYRHYNTFENSQSESSDDVFDNFKASSYQQYQGEKLGKRFNAFSYVTLSKAMDSHNVGRKRGGIEKALKEIKAKTLVVGINTDVLFPVSEQKTIANHVPGAIYEEIKSLYGHDGFLLETDKLKTLIQTHFSEASFLKKKDLQEPKVFALNEDVVGVQTGTI